MIFVVLAVCCQVIAQRKKVVTLDEQQSTTEDYSIEIKVRNKTHHHSFNTPLDVIIIRISSRLIIFFYN